MCCIGQRLCDHDTLRPPPSATSEQHESVGILLLYCTIVMLVRKSLQDAANCLSQNYTVPGSMIVNPQQCGALSDCRHDYQVPRVFGTVVGLLLYTPESIMHTTTSSDLKGDHIAR